MRTVAIACQGGGSHTAFTGGVLQRLLARVTHYPNTKLVVDLPAQTLTVPVWEESFHFDLDPYKKECLINGYDDIDYLLSQRDTITTYEEERTWII